jgi:hypothetical protein
MRLAEGISAIFLFFQSDRYVAKFKKLEKYEFTPKQWWPEIASISRSYCTRRMNFLNILGFK